LALRISLQAHKIHTMGAKVTLAVQGEQLGLGHAVLSAGESLHKGEPFVLMLGDHLYRSRQPEGVSCVQQVLGAFQGTSIMSLKRTAQSQVSLFGCATGTWETREKGGTPNKLSITGLVEKPTLQEAKAKLGMPGLATDEFLTAFGIYLVAEPASLFATLQAQLDQHGKALHNERIELTPALDELRREHSLVGLLVEGERYDIGGEPQTFIRTLNALAPAAEAAQ
jgi:UTP--glucose-1-phosphate uridylyltransferase